MVLLNALSATLTHSLKTNFKENFLITLEVSYTLLWAPAAWCRAMILRNHFVRGCLHICLSFYAAGSSGRGTAFLTRNSLNSSSSHCSKHTAGAQEIQEKEERRSGISSHSPALPCRLWGRRRDRGAWCEGWAPLRRRDTLDKTAGTY